MKRVIIVGSPRSAGRSGHLAEMLFEACIDERPQDELFLVPVSEVEIGPCIGCGACRKPSEVILKDDAGAEVSELKHRCVFDDDMQALYDILDEADELVVVSPVYFSGAPAPMKCVLDRLQPYFWSDVRKAPKRPATLHVVGEGGDPHGYDALVSEVRSALAVAGFRLERVLDWVGKIAPDGEIEDEAVERMVDANAFGANVLVDRDGVGATGAAGVAGDGEDRIPSAQDTAGRLTDASDSDAFETGRRAQPKPAKNRAKLDLSGGMRAASGASRNASNKPRADSRKPSSASSRKNKSSRGQTAAASGNGAASAGANRGSGAGRNRAAGTSGGAGGKGAASRNGNSAKKGKRRG